jgi:hypothetical protein
VRLSYVVGAAQQSGRGSRQQGPLRPGCWQVAGRIYLPPSVRGGRPMWLPHRLPLTIPCFVVCTGRAGCHLRTAAVPAVSCRLCRDGKKLMNELPASSGSGSPARRVHAPGGICMCHAHWGGRIIAMGRPHHCVTNNGHKLDCGLCRGRHACRYVCHAAAIIYGALCGHAPHTCQPERVLAPSAASVFRKVSLVCAENRPATAPACTRRGGRRRDGYASREQQAASSYSCT